MKFKRFAVVFALLALMTAAVSAHDETDSERFRPMKHALSGFTLENEALLQATGLDAEALRTALMEGSTIAELIEANDGDVSAAIANVVTRMTEGINAGAASILEGLEERVSEEFGESQTFRGPWGRRWHRLPRYFGYAGAGDVVMEATGLDAAGLRAALADGSTIAELIEANEGDAETVVAEVAAIVTDAVNAAAAERVASLEENVTELFNSDLADRWRKGRRGRMKARAFFGFWSMPGAPAVEAPAG